MDMQEWFKKELSAWMEKQFIQNEKFNTLYEQFKKGLLKTNDESVTKISCQAENIADEIDLIRIDDEPAAKSVSRPAVLPAASSNKSFSPRSLSDTSATVHRSAKTKSDFLNKNLLIIVLAVLGTFFVGYGIVKIFDLSWDKLPNWLKTFIAFIPILISQGLTVFTIKKRPNSTAYRESSALFAMLSIFACLGLIANIYNLTSSGGAFVATCILLSLPNIYVLNAKVPVLFYVLGIFVSNVAAGNVPLDPTTWKYWLFIPILPFFVYNFIYSKSRDVNIYLIVLLVLSFIVYIVSFFAREKIFPAEALLILGVSGLLIDACIVRWRAVYLMTFIKYASLIALTVSLFIYNFPPKPELYDMQDLFSLTSAGLKWVLWVGILYAVIRLIEFPKSIESSLSSPDDQPKIFLRSPMWELCKNRFISIDLFIIVAVVLEFSQFINVTYHSSKEFQFDTAGFANILSWVLGIYYLLIGGNRLVSRYINIGFYFTFSVVLIRLLLTKMDDLYRGLFFIVMGLSFLAVNFIITMKKRNNNNEQQK